MGPAVRDERGDVVVNAERLTRWRSVAHHHPDGPGDDATQWELYDTIATTYPLALEQEQHAMIRQLRSHLPAVPQRQRMALIDRIERSIGQNLEEEVDFGQ